MAIPKTCPIQIKDLRHLVSNSGGPGYRVYYTQRGDRLLLLLVGGDKSTQSKDIERAILLARGFEE